MKFSYKLLKNLVPKISSIEDFVEKLELHLFEVESVSGDVLDIKILPNRYDAASYFGLAKEISAILGRNFKVPSSKFQIPNKLQVPSSKLQISIKTNLCRRMAAVYIESLKISESPQWLKDALVSSGQRPINNLVDITNYITLETGQPLHAFDFNKMDGGELNVRPAMKGEDVETLDGQKFDLEINTLVLADKVYPLDVAGIKGGKRAEITNKTKNILLTAGNFDGAAIYRTSRRLGLITDASVRFSHNLHPDLVELGLSRAIELIKELCNGQAGLVKDVYPKPYKRAPIKFDVKKFNQLSGLNLSSREALAYLKRLDLTYRTDIERFEDLVEEVCRLYGYQKLPATPPQVALRPSEFDDLVVLKDKARRLLTSFGLDEVYNYSFLPKGEIKLENPTSSELAYLRPSLIPSLTKSMEGNLRYFERVAIFEIGKVFKSKNSEISEELILGIALQDFLELKGIVSQLLEGVGIGEYFFREDPAGGLRIESDHTVLGNIWLSHNHNLAEIDLGKVLRLAGEETEFRPLAKYPAVMRDISILVSGDVRIGEIMETIENIPNHLIDLDLADIYDSPDLGEDKQSLTFRLIFQAQDRTLTDSEVNSEIKKISAVLKEKFDAEIR